MGQRIYKGFMIGLALIFSTLLFAVPATLAGGWAVITLDQLPAQVVAGQPITLGFVVRQHGRWPMAELTPQLTAVHAATHRSLTVAAQPEGEIGHYAATLTLPEAGQWDWSIQAFTMDQLMPPLTVLATAPSPNVERKIPQFWSILIGTAGIIGAVGTSLAWWRKRNGWAASLVLVTLVAGGAGFVSAANQPTEPVLAVDPVTLAEKGQHLFMAKGCITCHQHSAMKSSQQYFSLDIGKDLTNLSATPAYLRPWLKNPAALKPNTQMPNLDLSHDEIEALIAFLIGPQPDGAAQ